MKRRNLFSLALFCALTCSIVAAAQEKGYWRAASSTAKSITGDLTFSENKITINFASFTIAQIRALQPAESAAAFDAEGGAAGGGNLYRVEIPAEKKFSHRNTLCGSQDTQWIATYVLGRNLQLAFFSGAQMPVFTSDALASTPNLCGTFSYVR